MNYVILHFPYVSPQRPRAQALWEYLGKHCDPCTTSLCYFGVWFLLYRLCLIKFPCDALMRMYSTSNKISMKSSRVMGRPSAYFHAFCKKSKIGTLKKIFFQKKHPRLFSFVMEQSTSWSGPLFLECAPGKGSYFSKSSEGKCLATSDMSISWRVSWPSWIPGMWCVIRMLWLGPPLMMTWGS